MAGTIAKKNIIIKLIQIDPIDPKDVHVLNM